jgi:hypothetical protein
MEPGDSSPHSHKPSIGPYPTLQYLRQNPPAYFDVTGYSLLKLSVLQILVTMAILHNCQGFKVFDIFAMYSLYGSSFTIPPVSAYFPYFEKNK